MTLNQEKQRIAETAERIVIDYANLSGRESENRSEFRERVINHLDTLHAAVVRELGNRLIEQIEVAILAQEQGINDRARLLGLDKWLDGAGIVKTKYDQDKLEGQKDLLRWIKKGYFPALPADPQENKKP